MNPAECDQFCRELPTCKNALLIASICTDG